MLCYETAKTATEEEFKALTSLTKTEFEELLKSFSQVWEESRGTLTKPARGRPATLSKNEDKLLFILFYLKNYPLQEVLGFLFGLDQSQANGWIKTLSRVLRETLKRGGFLPAREANQLAADLAESPSLDLILDGTERRLQRPTDPEAQTHYYSGKKAHTVKNLLVVNESSRRIEYLSPTVEGKKHDKKLADDCALVLPPAATVLKDKAFYGYEVPNACNYQPQKKPRGSELSPLQQTLNSVISGVRIVVEHVIAGLKRCRVVKDIFRNSLEKFDDLVMEIACGLHNLRVTSRNHHQLVKTRH